MQNNLISIINTSLYGSQSSFVAFACKTASLGPELQVSVSQPSSVVLCIHNSDIMTRINSLYGSQSSPVVLCMQNSMISTGNTSLHGSQTSPVILCMQNIVISIRKTSLHWFQTSPVVLWMQNNVISIRNTSLYGCQPSFVVFACKTATLGPELQVSMGPRHHRCFFCIQKSDFSTRIASLYGS